MAHPSPEVLDDVIRLAVAATRPSSHSIRQAKCERYQVAKAYHSGYVDTVVAWLTALPPFQGTLPDLIVKIEPTSPRLDARLRAEAEFYRNIRRPWLPQLVAYVEAKNFTALVTRPVADAWALDAAVLGGHIDGKELALNISTVTRWLTEDVHGPPIQHDIDQIWNTFLDSFFHRPQRRLASLADSIVSKHQTELVSTCQEFLTFIPHWQAQLSVILPPLVRHVHGDPHLGNVLVSKANKRAVAIIDPKLRWHESPLYDFGKIIQSFSGCYANLVYEKRGNGQYAKFDAEYVIRQSVVGHIIHHFGDHPHWESLLLLTAGVHLIAAAPHHRYVPGQVIPMLQSGLRLAVCACEGLGLNRVISKGYAS